MIKNYNLYNLEKESNQNNILKIFSHIFKIESNWWINLKLYVWYFFAMFIFIFQQKWKSSHRIFLKNFGLDFQKKQEEGPKNFEIQLISSKNQGSKMIKFYTLYNLEIESK